MYIMYILDMPEAHYIKFGYVDDWAKYSLSINA